MKGSNMTLNILILQGIQLEREEQGVEGLRGELLLRGAQRRHLLQRARDARAAVQAAPQGRPAAVQLQARRQAQAPLQAGAQDAAIQVGRPESRKAFPKQVCDRSNYSVCIDLV